MAVTQRKFGNAPDGSEITLYTIKNESGFTAEVTNFGAILVNVLVPDKDGNVADVALGYDKLEDYVERGGFFGATVGPSANRIANACFEINGKTYHLVANNGKNNLHSDKEKGYHKQVWSAKVGDDSVSFALEDPDGSMGFPGNKKVNVTYTVTADNGIKIDYNVTSDMPTLINMTNHSYFNLAGHNAGSIEDHNVFIDAFHYTPVTEDVIPTGAFAPVEGTPFDFREMRRIGDRIEADDDQLKYAGGYDHNYVIDNHDGSVKKIAVAEDPVTGRKMEVYTDQPGVHFYVGNSIHPQIGKAGASYGKRCGLCFETQAFPDSIHQPHFTDVVYGPDRPYNTTTIFKFIW